MEFTVKPIHLPLDPTIDRCLGHWQRKGEWCAERDRCARHVTIRVLAEPWHETKPPMYRMCTSDRFDLKLPLEGFAE